MATNWTDATLYSEAEAVASLPKILDLTTSADTYFHTEVKDEIGQEIKYRYHDLKDFDIEEITAASLTALKQCALNLNTFYVCRDEVVNGNEDDTFVRLRDEYFSRYLYYIKRQIELMEFDEPEGVNDLKAFSYAIKR